ncbi:MAG: alpha/beta hydrolase [Nitrosomonadales bacterium]|nr:alpha/beta hydrolase [Nitrosomonadales bacterium]
MIWHILSILAAAYAGFALLLYFFQSRMVFYPETGREITATPAQIGLPYEDIQLKTSDNISLHGWYIPVAKPRGTVLFLHGNAGNISHRIDSVQMFHRMGYSTLIFDYRGYGNSGGAPSEQGTYRDAEAAWRYLADQRRIPSCRIVLFGESLGGAVGAWLAATSRDTLLVEQLATRLGEPTTPAKSLVMAEPADCGSGSEKLLAGHPCEAAIPAPDAPQRRVMAARQKPAALVIASGFTSVPDLARHFYPYLPVQWLARIRYDTRESLRAVAAPVLIAHSPEDEIVPFEHGRALLAAANPPKRFLELAGGHNDGFIFMREAWVKALEDFLDEHVNAACARPIETPK